VCTNGTTCDECLPTFLFKHDIEINQNFCVTDCGFRYFPSYNLCLHCDFRCKNCTGPLNTECPVCDILKEGIYNSEVNTCSCMNGYATSLELQKCFRIFLYD